jgi:hypothetical protein
LTLLRVFAATAWKCWSVRECRKKRVSRIFCIDALEASLTRLPWGTRSNAILQSLVCAEVEFSDYGTVLRAPANRNESRKALRFKYLHSRTRFWESNTVRHASTGAPSAKILHPNFLAEDELINNALEFTKWISCNFHEELKAMRYCSLSYVQRWSFQIMEQCCGPLPNRNESRKALWFKYLRSRTRSWKSNTVCHDMPFSRSLWGEPLSAKNRCQ